MTNQMLIEEKEETTAVGFPQIALAFLTFILIGMNDGAFGVLIPSLQSHYGIDKATVGYLFMAGTLGYLIAAFTSGLLVEKLGQRLFLIVGAGVFVAGALIFSQKIPFPLVVLGPMLLGYGVGSLDAGLNSYIARLPNNTKLLNYLHAFYGVGALLGPIVASSFLAFGWDWSNVYLVWLAISLLLIIGFYFVYPATSPYAHESHQSSSNLMQDTLRLRVVWLAAAFLLFYVGTEVSLGNWGFSFLTQERHEPELLSGWAISGYWFGLTVGRFLLGRVAERIGNTRLIQGCLAGVVVGVLIIWLVPVGALSALGLWIVGFSLGPIFPTTIAILPGMVPSRLLSAAIGFLASLGSMGAAFFPWLAGNLAQAFGLWTLMPFVVLLTAVMLGVWMILNSGKITNMGVEDAN